MRIGSGSVLCGVVLAIAASPCFAQQGSLTLKDSDVELCHRNVTSWSLSKVGALADGSVTWTVTATKGATTPDTLSAFGFVRVQNTGTAGATLGNIVVNLQRRQGNKWVTKSSDIANATDGDAAVKALIVPGASSEGKSSFEENAASGPLSFTDADSNSIFSLVPAFTLPAGETLDLLFRADFNTSVLNIPDGELVRFEVIVTFGNAGARGGSGASGKCIDINGNGTVDPVEKYVRSVPTRLTRALPELEECGRTVLLTDTPAGISTTGTVTWSEFSTTIGGGSGSQLLEDSGVFFTSVSVSPGAAGGYVTNTATLYSPGDSIVLEALDLLTGFPLYHYEVECCPELDLTASYPVWVPPATDVEEEPEGPVGYTTYSQGGWGGNGEPSDVLFGGFATVYQSGVVIGGGKTLTFTSAAAVKAFLPAGGPASFLTQNLINPTSSSGGNLAGQVLALQLSVDFSDKLVTAEGLGDLVLDGTGGSLDGQTVRQILGVANVALGGGGLPAGYTFGTLNTLITNLNEAFDAGISSGWALAHLSEGT